MQTAAASVPCCPLTEMRRDCPRLARIKRPQPVHLDPDSDSSGHTKSKDPKQTCHAAAERVVGECDDQSVAAPRRSMLRTRFAASAPSCALSFFNAKFQLELRLQAMEGGHARVR